MQKNNYKKTIYYNDNTLEVLKANITPKKIDSNYKYTSKNFFYKIWSSLSYRLLAMPYFWLYFKINHVHFANKQALKQIKTGFFIYGNHTQQFTDGTSASIAMPNKRPSLLCIAENVSMPFWSHFTKMWGALPLPDDIQATRNFEQELKNRLDKNNPIVIYPEAHLWPYYTHIRDYDARSFRYPVKYNLPMFVFTTTYQKRKHGKKPNIIIFIDGPFYPDQSLDRKQAQQKLCDTAKTIMHNNSKLSTYEYYNYIKESNND